MHPKTPLQAKTWIEQLMERARYSYSLAAIAAGGMIWLFRSRVDVAMVATGALFIYGVSTLVGKAAMRLDRR